ncbi:MAG: TolC family protein, partial [Geobacteraceae bacterium]|nr:TolC family protein [Geobacteraceae bacterium]
MYISLCALGLVLLLAWPTYAQQISLDAALERASTHATELQRLQKQQQLARATHTRSAQAFLPRISADSTWIRADAEALEHIPSLNLRATPPGITTQDYGPVEGIVSGINIVQPLIHVEGWAGRAQAGTAARARKAATEWGAQMLKLKTAQAYFGVHIQGAVLHAAQQALHAAQQALEAATANFSEGLVSRLDVTRASAEAQSAQARVFAAETELNKAKNDLAALLGLNPAKPIRVTTPLPQPLPPTGYPLPQQQRADIAARELSLKSAAVGVDKARARIFPQVNLLARQQWVDGDKEFEDYGDAWLVGVNLEWNLFDGLDRVGEIAEAKAQANLARVEVTEKKRAAEAQQHNTFNDWVSSWKAWQASQAAVDSAVSAADLAARRYAEGLGNLTEVLLTRAELFQHQVSTSRYQYQTLLAGMSYYLHHGY